MQNLRIAIFTHNYPASQTDRQNAGIFVHDIATELKQLGLKVMVVCQGSSDKEETVGEIPVLWFSCYGGRSLGQLRFWNPQDIIRFALFFYKGIKRAGALVGRKPAISLAMWAFPGGVFAWYLKKRFGVPYGVWALGSDIYIYAKVPILRQLIKKVLTEADFLLADGIDLAREVERLSGKKCVFLPSASQLGKVNQGVKLSRGKKDIAITFLGRMEKVKGPDILIDSLMEIRKKLGGQVNFVGHGNLLPELKSKSKQMVSFKIKFYGNISDPRRISKILQNSDWVIIPSRSDSIPLVFSEAMRNNTPVVVAGLPDLAYLVNKYKVGYIFDPGDQSALAKIIESLPERQEEQRSFSKNTAKVAKIFSVEQSAKRLLNYFKKIK